MKNFLNYYQDELLFLREKGGVFAKEHTEIANKLDIKNGESSDPHTERIIESVAFMSAKLNKKIDDNSQSVAFYLLSALYPNLINVFPPCSIAKFESSNGIQISDNVRIPKNTSVFANSKSGIDCVFKTIYPLTIYPIKIDSVGLLKTNQKIGGTDGWCIDIKISTNSLPVENLSISDLMFHINSEIIEDSLMIYESIFSNPNRNIFLKIDNRYISIDSENIIPCGFEDEDSVCPVPKYSNNSFQLFQEMLHFKRKFMFFRILNLNKIINESGIKDISEISILIDINFRDERLTHIVKNDSIIINATPIVNLFSITSDPFRFDGTKTKYLLVADQMKDRSLEIHSISEIHMIDSETKDDHIVQPYFSLAVDSDTNVIHDVFWTHSKESADIRNLEGFDTYISFVDTKMNPKNVYSDIVYATTLCTNRFESRDIPVFSKLHVEGIETAGYIGKLLNKTTKPIPFVESSSSLWNLISQLSSTHISLANEGNLFSTIASLVKLFSAGINLKVEEMLGGIKSISTKKVVKRFGADAWRGFVEGVEISIHIKDDQNTFFSYFFSSILNQYLSACVSINSFVELILVSDSSGKILSRFNPTSGRKDFI